MVVVGVGGLGGGDGGLGGDDRGVTLGSRMSGGLKQVWVGMVGGWYGWKWQFWTL